MSEVTKDLATVNVNQVSKVIEETKEILNRLPIAMSRLNSVMKQPFKVVDKEKINYLQERMTEINDKVYNFSKKDSRTTRAFMTLQMHNPADSTYRILRQLLAQIERKQNAITENFFRLSKQQVKLEKLFRKLEETEDDLDKKLVMIDIQKLVIEITNAMSYLEAAIKELGAQVEDYEHIKKSKGIDDNWSEEDFEKEEIKHHIRNAFRLGIRDHMVHGRLGMGTVEYFEDFGISYMEAAFHIRNFVDKCNLNLNKINQKMKNISDEKEKLKYVIEQLPDYDLLQDFISEMAELYKDHYKKVCRRIGLKEDMLSTKFVLTKARVLELEGKVNNDDDIN